MYKIDRELIDGETKLTFLELDLNFHILFRTYKTDREQMGGEKTNSFRTGPQFLSLI